MQSKSGKQVAEQPSSYKTEGITEGGSSLQLRLRANEMLMEAESARLNHAPVTALASAASAVEAALKLEEGLKGNAKGFFHLALAQKILHGAS